MANPMVTAEGGGVGSSKARTTYVQADSTCFRDLVQRLTGPSAPKSTKKLHERRKCYKPNTEIGIQFRQPSNRSSPCSPSLSSSRARPNKRAPSPSNIEDLLNHEEEEKAIKEKKFYLHPSPRSKPRLTEEQKHNCLPCFLQKRRRRQEENETTIKLIFSTCSMFQRSIQRTLGVASTPAIVSYELTMHNTTAKIILNSLSTDSEVTYRS